MGDAGAPLDAGLAGYNASRVFGRALPAVAFHPRPKRRTGVKLLSGEEATQDPLAATAAEPEEEEEEEEAVAGGTYGETPAAGAKPKRPREIISFLKPNLTVAVVDDFTVYNAKAVPDHVRCVCVGGRSEGGLIIFCRLGSQPSRFWAHLPHPNPSRCAPCSTSTPPP